MYYTIYNWVGLSKPTLIIQVESYMEIHGLCNLGHDRQGRLLTQKLCEVDVA